MEAREVILAGDHFVCALEVFPSQEFGICKIFIFLRIVI